MAHKHSDKIDEFGVHAKKLPRIDEFESLITNIIDSSKEDALFIINKEKREFKEDQESKKKRFNSDNSKFKGDRFNFDDSISVEAIYAILKGICGEVEKLEMSKKWMNEPVKTKRETATILLEVGVCSIGYIPEKFVHSIESKLPTELINRLRFLQAEVIKNPKI